MTALRLVPRPRSLTPTGTRTEIAAVVLSPHPLSRGARARLAAGVTPALLDVARRRGLAPERYEVRTLTGADDWKVHADPGLRRAVLAELARTPQFPICVVMTVHPAG